MAWLTQHRLQDFAAHIGLIAGAYAMHFSHTFGCNAVENVFAAQHCSTQ